MESFVEISKKNAVEGMEMFLRNFSHVPDAKLAWTPAPGAKSAIRIAAHAALYMGRFAQMIEDRQLPQPESLEDWLAEKVAEEVALTDRVEMERVFRAGTDRVLAALDGLSSEDVALILDSGQGWTTSMRFLMSLPGWHATLHMGQIDYLQTCWGDQEIYVG